MMVPALCRLLATAAVLGAALLARAAKNEDGAEAEEQYVEGEETIPEEETAVVCVTRLLTTEEIRAGLSSLGKTAEGNGYAYLQLTCTGKGLTNVEAIKYFKNLQYVDVSNNKLDLNALKPITDLPYLILLRADKNTIVSAALRKCKYLQVLVLNDNMLTTVEDVYQPELSTLEVANNKIEKLYFKSPMPQMRVLDCRHNILNNISDINFVNLDSLFVAGNRIKSLVGIACLVNLRILHMRHNPINNLDGISATLAKLKYINFRNCKIGSLFQIKKLRPLPVLETLVIRGCPFMGGTGIEGPEAVEEEEEEDPDTRLEVLAALTRLKRLNKTVVTAEERVQAKELMMQWLEEGENDVDDLLEEEVGEEQSAT